MRMLLPRMAMIVVFLYVLPAYAGQPLEAVKTQVTRILEILGDPDLTGESNKAMKIAKIREVSQDLFDFTEVSKRTLGFNWKKFNPDQQAEFVDLYRTILQNVYQDLLLKYEDERVDFHRERMLSKTKAEVYSNLITQTAQIPINYKVHLVDQQWRVYEVLIEGVSMNKNYRIQFKKNLRRSTPDKFLQQLREKATSQG